MSSGPQPITPLKLLLSAFAEETWGKRIAAAVPPGCIAFITAEAAIADPAPCAADIAFMTREVTGKSSKNNPTQELTNFEAVLRKSPRLRWLQIHPAGGERIIYRELQSRSVTVTTASGATAVTVAHSALGAIIALNRRFPLLADAQRRHAWEPRLGERAPQTMTFDAMHQALPRADWLVLCCPASPLTRGIADARAFAAMPIGSHLINVSRGEVAIERDIVDALSAGRLAGAYLDVFEREPLDPGSALWDLPNVIISPHTASHSLGQNEAIFEIFLENLQRLRKGEKLRNDIADLN